MKCIEFINDYDAIIALKGNLPKKDFFEHFIGIPILAADGAALKLAKKGIIPDFIIGDLDSIMKRNRSSVFKEDTIIHLPDQETNDFEKALNFATEKGYERILLLGFHGGDLEHTLNNLSVFLKFSSKMKLCIFDKRRYAVLINSNSRIQVNNGETISLIPSPKVTLSTLNLKWKLFLEELELGSREGARNIAVSNFIELEIHSGSLLLCLDARLPYSI